MSTHQPPRAAAPASGTGTPDARQLRTILIAVSVALMAVIASVSGLNVAQTQMAVEFGASQNTVLWIINIYTLALAALLLPLGAIGDRLGRKPMLIAGLTVFGAASVVAGLAPSAGVMIAARVAAGVSAAMIMPITLAVITSTFPAEQRGKAIGVWTGVAGGGGILGMFLSALLVDVADWRRLFVLPVVLVVVALVMTLKSVPNSRRDAAHSFDTAGASLSAVAVIGLIFVLQEGPERGWTAPVTLTGLAVGVLAAVGFVAWELRRRDAALLDVRLFRERGLAGGSITLLVVFGVQAGVAVVLFPFFQAVLGWSGLLSTVAMMPMAVMMMLASGLAPRMAARVGARSTMAAGVALAMLGLVLMAVFVSVDGGYLSVLAGLLAMGVGMGLSMTPSTEAITNSLPRAEQGVAAHAVYKEAEPGREARVVLSTESNAFAWLRRSAHFEGFPGGPLLDETFDRVLPTHVIAGCNLLDFQDMDIDSKGRIHIGWADGCVGDCAETGEAEASATGTAPCSAARATSQLSSSLTRIAAVTSATAARTSGSSSKPAFRYC